MNNRLKHLDEFREILTNYRISKENQAILDKAKLVLLDGPTSSGRNTVIEKLTETGDYYHIVADTTRQPRQKDHEPIEENGREYWFRSEEYMMNGLKNGEYMEAAIIHNQQVSGCNIRELEKANKFEKIAIKDIEPNGALTIHKAKPDTKFMFIVPPSFDEWMLRIQKRGNMLESEKRRRLQSAVKEFEAGLTHDYYKLVLNKTIDEAVREVHEIVQGYVDPEKQARYQELVKGLLRDTKKALSGT